MTQAEQIDRLDCLEGQALKDEARRLLKRTFLYDAALKVSEKMVRQYRRIMTIDQLAEENIVLREQLQRLQQKLFGNSSERRTSDLWRETADEAPPDPETSAAPSSAPENMPETSAAPSQAPEKPRRGPRPQPRLATREERHTLTDERCELCGELLRPTGLTEDSEEVTVVERRFFVVTHHHDKCRCPSGCTMKTARGPKRWMKGGRYSLDFALQVIDGKYGYHMPLARQQRMMAAEGLEVSRVTLWDLCDAVAEMLEPSYTKLLMLILSSDQISADESWWRLMEKGNTEKWWVWCLTTHDAAWYHLDPSRSAKVLGSVLEGFEGVLMCDAYIAYVTLAKANPMLRLGLCWSHARRKFVEAQKAYPRECKVALDIIGELFLVEREVPDPAALEGDEKVAALDKLRELRDKRSRKAIDALDKWMSEQKALPKSGLGLAISYVRNHWDGLRTFLDDPLIPLHNNRTERALRGPVVGRKNHYGSRSERGTVVAAIFYSLIETCKLIGVNAMVYLRKAVEKALQEPGSALLPHELLARPQEQPPS